MSITVRSAIIQELEILARASLQMEYELTLVGRAGHAPTELIESFCTDLFSPKSPAFIDAFNESELKDLAHLYGLLCEVNVTPSNTVSDMLRNPSWRRVSAKAKEIHERLRHDA